MKPDMLFQEFEGFGEGEMGHKVVGTPLNSLQLGAHCGGTQGVVGTNTGSPGCAISVLSMVRQRQPIIAETMIRHSDILLIVDHVFSNVQSSF